VTSLKKFMAQQGDTPRASRAATARLVREDAGGVSTVRSLGSDAASVALPSGIDLEDRAARMNEFWDKLVDYQHRNVLVVALCVGDER
jgi:hypothetical protein